MTLPGLCVLILARLRAQLFLEGYPLKDTPTPPQSASAEVRDKNTGFGRLLPFKSLGGSSRVICFCLRVLRIRKNLMWNSVAVAVERSDIIVRLKRIGYDHHDPPVKVVKVLN